MCSHHHTTTKPPPAFCRLSHTSPRNSPPFPPSPCPFCRLSLFAAKAFATGYGATNTHRRQLANEASYKKSRFAEVNDNPLYRLPENPNGGHRLDGLSSQQARRVALSHH